MCYILMLMVKNRNNALRYTPLCDCKQLNFISYSRNCNTSCVKNKVKNRSFASGQNFVFTAGWFHLMTAGTSCEPCAVFIHGPLKQTELLRIIMNLFTVYVWYCVFLYFILQKNLLYVFHLLHCDN